MSAQHQTPTLNWSGSGDQLTRPPESQLGCLQTPTWAPDPGQPARAQGTDRFHVPALNSPSLAWPPGQAQASALTLLASGCPSGPKCPLHSSPVDLFRPEILLP